jgi:hypothetical protein
MTAPMRICLAAIALVALGVLGAGLALGFRAPRTAAAGPARPSPSRPAPASPRAASPRTSPTPAAADYSFGTLDNPGDATFNELLSINNRGHIGGYFGSGAAGHPNTGYILRPPYDHAKYQKIMFPGSAQTQLTSLNNTGVQVGFWTAGGSGHRIDGWYLDNSQFRSVTDSASSPVNELLGVNDHNIAVGFYTDARGLDHAFTYNIATKRFGAITVAGANSVVAAAINNAGTVAGFFTGGAGRTEGFVLSPGGQLSTLEFPGATATRATGVNDAGEVVGYYQLGTAGMHGFTWTSARGFAIVNGPGGAVSTAITGVNDAGDLVGYYTDRAGHTDGLLATPEG